MAKKIRWALQAQNDRKQILNYWNERNKSKTYSKKLNQLFKKSVKLIAKYPRIGKPTDYFNIRTKIVKEYQIFYEEISDIIYILRIWDNRQDPDKLKMKIK